MKDFRYHFTSATTLAVVGVIALAIYLTLFFPKGRADYPIPTPTPAASGPANIPVTYAGEDGRNALELLQEHSESEVSGSGENAKVITINGHKPDPAKESWNLYINGQKINQSPATVVTKASDSIEWRLETGHE